MKGRSFAEWTTFAVASAIVALVLGLIVADIPGEETPPSVTADLIGTPQERGANFVVTVEVRNEGGATAENVQVSAELTVGDDTQEADQLIDFLSGGESEEMEFVFDQDPESGELEVRVTGYAVP